eukprot:scaffold707_cov399-Prasinococcus_capsulatus_cf.AAC.36
MTRRGSFSRRSQSSIFRSPCTVSEVASAGQAACCARSGVARRCSSCGATAPHPAVLTAWASALGTYGRVFQPWRPKLPSTSSSCVPTSSSPRAGGAPPDRLVVGARAPRPPMVDHVQREESRATRVAEEGSLLRACGWRQRKAASRCCSAAYAARATPLGAAPDTPLRLRQGAARGHSQSGGARQRAAALYPPPPSSRALGPGPNDPISSRRAQRPAARPSSRPSIHPSIRHHPQGPRRQEACHASRGKGSSTSTARSCGSLTVGLARRGRLQLHDALHQLEGRCCDVVREEEDVEGRAILAGEDRAAATTHRARRGRGARGGRLLVRDDEEEAGGAQRAAAGAQARAEGARGDHPNRPRGAATDGPSTKSAAPRGDGRQSVGRAGPRRSSTGTRVLLALPRAPGARGDAAADDELMGAQG